MKVCEIFSSIQGESTYAGVPFTFIRMTGCNLRCSYCDTVYAYEEGTELTEEEIMERIQAIGLKTVEITGGEPLLQKDVPLLARRLLDEGYTVLIETNGSQDIRGVDKRAVMVLDIKTPGSGMADKMRLSNLPLLGPGDEVKFVITDRNDYEWAKNLCQRTFLCREVHGPLFSCFRSSGSPASLRMDTER